MPRKQLKNGFNPDAQSREARVKVVKRGIQMSHVFVDEASGISHKLADELGSIGKVVSSSSPALKSAEKAMADFSKIVGGASMSHSIVWSDWGSFFGPPPLTVFIDQYGRTNYGIDPAAGNREMQRARRVERGHPEAPTLDAALKRLTWEIKHATDDEVDALASTLLTEVTSAILTEKRRRDARRKR